MLQRSFIRLVLVGLSVAIDLQKRQCTVRSHESIANNLLQYNTPHLSHICSGKREQLGMGMCTVFNKKNFCLKAVGTGEVSSV
jgi:hypothetical protein